MDNERKVTPWAPGVLLLSRARRPVVRHRALPGREAQVLRRSVLVRCQANILSRCLRGLALATIASTSADSFCTRRPEAMK